MKVSLNFCDIGTIISGKKLLSEAWDEARDICNFKPEMMYIGSYFCDHYFLSITNAMTEEMCQFAKAHDMKIVLVIPTPSETTLFAVKTKIQEMTDLIGNLLLMYVVNDFGMLSYIDRTYTLNITLGRMMYKVTRDGRYDYFLSRNTDVACCSSYLHTLIQAYKICGIEMENIADDTQIQNLYGYQVMVHIPMVMATTGRVCEFASIPLRDSSKFRPLISCIHSCTKCMTSYEVNNGLIYHKIGKTVFYRQKTVIEIPTHITQNLIVFPMRTVRKCYENTCTIK